MEPQQLSLELRTGQSPDMTRRRWIIGLSMLGGSMGQLVTLYQTGIIDYLPDPPGQQLFDADRVDASNYAYSRFNSPDGPIMVFLPTNCNGHQALIRLRYRRRVSAGRVEREQSVLRILSNCHALFVRLVSFGSTRGCDRYSYPARTSRRRH